MKWLNYYIILVLVGAEDQMESEDRYTTDAQNYDISDGLNKMFAKFKEKKKNYLELLDKNPDIKRSTSELIASRGFHSEEHTVVTDDGYILGIFRIVNPYIKPSSRLKPVLMWHQIATNSNQWLISNPGFLDKSGQYSERNATLRNNCGKRLTSNLALTLAACGYDVWLGNSRGNRYSPRHITRPFYSKQYANYTFTELGVYDAKNTIEYILRKTQKRCLAYIGSSRGTTIIFTLLSLIPKFERYVSPVISMPPIAYLGNTTSIIRFATPLVPILNDLVINVGIPLIVAEAIAELCGNFLLKPFCIKLNDIPIENVPSYLTDSETKILEFSDIGDNYISSKIYLQYGQFILNGRFNQFDYMNPKVNYQVYGQPEAPDYPLEDIRSNNLVFFLGLNDALSTKGDLDHMINSLSVSPLDVYVIDHAPTYNHQDYIHAKKNNIFINWRILGHLSDNHFKISDNFDPDYYSELA